jgi:hypothetical protein
MVKEPAAPIMNANPEEFALLIAGAGLGGALFVVQPATKSRATSRTLPSTCADTPILVNREARFIAAFLLALSGFRKRD